MEALWTDTRFALRMLVKNRASPPSQLSPWRWASVRTRPVFSVVNATMLEPLPFPNRDRLVMVWDRIHAEDASAT